MSWAGADAWLWGCRGVTETDLWLSSVLASCFYDPGKGVNKRDGVPALGVYIPEVEETNKCKDKGNQSPDKWQEGSHQGVIESTGVGGDFGCP